MQQWPLIFSTVGALFGVIALGAIARRVGWLTGEADKSIVRLIVNLLLPCFAIDTLIKAPPLGAGRALFLPPVVGAVFVLLGFGVAGGVVRLLGRKLGLVTRAQRATFIFCLGIFNYGYIPLPLARAIFPADLATPATLLLHNIGVEITLWTVGLMILTGNRPGAGTETKVGEGARAGAGPRIGARPAVGADLSPPDGPPFAGLGANAGPPAPPPPQTPTASKTPSPPPPQTPPPQQSPQSQTPPASAETATPPPRVSVIQRLLNPVVFAILLGAALNLTGHAGPATRPAAFNAVARVIELLGQVAIPLALLTIGATVADVWPVARFRQGMPVATAAVLLRLGILPAIFLLMMLALPGELPLRRVMAIEAAMPCGIFPILIARHYGGDAPTAVRVTVVTSLIGLATIPLWLLIGLART